MEDYYQYFPVNEKDTARGLTLLNTGSTRIDKNSQYPPVAHPAHHNFSWQDGRVLQEYQLIYITRGGGLFESESCRSAVVEGSIILLQPGERHRYRPHWTSGWDETWVGFRGNMVDNIIRENGFRRENAVFSPGLNETIVRLFNDINRFSRRGGPGYQPVIAGAVIYLLGLISAECREAGVADRREVMVNRARAIFRERVCDNISPEQVAEELRVSYSLFRKAFKQHTGLAPGQYLLGLKIELAKQLLADPNRLIKEIAYELNMDSPLYFGKLFKEKVGVTAVEYRRQVITQKL